MVSLSSFAAPSTTFSCSHALGCYSWAQTAARRDMRNPLKNKNTELELGWACPRVVVTPRA
jgi:hypothetical protein